MREVWIDRWRGVLIATIVLLHSMGFVAQKMDLSVQAFLVEFGYRITFYHVTSFFVLAGVVWKPQVEFVPFVAKKAQRLLVPYFVFGFICATLFLIGGDTLIKSSGYCGMGNVPRWKYYLSVVLCHDGFDGLARMVVNVLWFLPCMFGVEVLYWLIDRYLPGRRCQLLLAIMCFGLGCVCLRYKVPWRMQQAPHCLIFLIIGRWFFSKSPLAISTKNRMAAIVLMFVAFGLVFVTGPLNFMFGFLRAPQWVYVGRALAGAIGTLLLAQTLPFKCLERVGGASLGILVVHNFVIKGLNFVPNIWTCFKGMNCIMGVALSFSLAGAALAISYGVVLLIRRSVPCVLGESKRS